MEPPVGVRLSEQQAWDELERAHTGILTTLRKDGWPVSLPTWFAVLDGRIYVRTPTKASKVGRVRRDARATFLVERGTAWVELAAVMVPVHAEIVDAESDEHHRASAAISAKYEGLGIPRRQVPKATREHYAGSSAVIRLTPAGEMLTWDNANLGRPKTESAGEGGKRNARLG